MIKIKCMPFPPDEECENIKIGKYSYKTVHKKTGMVIGLYDIRCIYGTDFKQQKEDNNEKEDAN